MPEIVAEPDRLDEILVQPERAGHRARDAGRLERVGEPRPVVVAGRVDEDLRLVHEAPEGLGVHDPVAVALERRPHRAPRLLLDRAAPRLVRTYGQRREGPLLLFADAYLEGFRDLSLQLRHC